jgi:hypothetical protein
MKNFIEIPRKEDYHETTLVDSTAGSGREPQHEKDLLLYHNGRINLRSIVDCHAFAIKIEVIDEEKFPEWEKARAEWVEKNKNRMKVVPMPGEMVVDPACEIPDGQYVASPFGGFGPPPPPAPTITKTLKVTIILYFSGVQRFIVDDYKDFCEMYDNYLTSQKLDF